jgi:SNF2 family DNA or RNA helicase
MEDGERWQSAPAALSGEHPFAASLATLRAALPGLGAPDSTCSLRLPASEGVAIASGRLALAHGRSSEHEGPTPGLQVFSAPSLRVEPTAAMHTLPALVEALRTAPEDRGIVAGGSLEFFALAAEFGRSLLAQQRFVPLLRQNVVGELQGVWYPWLSDETNAKRVAALLAGMPGVARAGADQAWERWPVLDAFLCGLIDGVCRRVLTREDFLDAVRERDPAADAHVAWLRGLLGGEPKVPALATQRLEIARRVRGWIGLLEDRGTGSAWRLCLRLNEPTNLPGSKDENVRWALSLHLQSVDRPGLILDAEDIWVLPADSATFHGVRVEAPQELLLAELGRASRLYKPLETALEDAAPTELSLDTRQAYEFLREVRPILLEQGFAVQAPDWWESPMARLGARLRIESDEPDPMAMPASIGSASASGSQVGLSTLVRYRWEIAVGDTSLTLHEFEQLAARRVPLVRVNGRWVEIRPEDVQAAIRFIRENPGGEMAVADALRMAYATDLKQTGIPVVGLEASGWLQGFLNSEAGAKQLTTIETPRQFRGTLRPYQIRGVSWMAFMERLGFGLCLADDMGLGKTVQLLALMAHEREVGSGPIGPTLLLVPMSVVGNWIHESARFCPNLRVLVHHGTTRHTGEDLARRALESDLVITTYALAHRDKDSLAKVAWWRVVLDEAQYIKNPAAKQTLAVRSLTAQRRVALTGTPVENRLTELWSIVDFLNPGFLGSASSFRQRFGVAVERFHDRQRGEQLRGLIRPFILRRLKTDPNVVADLPEKVETREYCHLTSEQASLYESCVRRMLVEVDEAEGIQRRGLVLSALVKLKQICNHPSQVLRDCPEGSGKPAEPARSGKCVRLMEILDELIAEGDKALVFTQFREMGTLLASMLRHRLGREVLFLHGGTTQAQRQQIIDTFQKDANSSPVLILSLKAGGVGLNLTAATHVIHFDRWWNPAVENQATDRAYRIGQTRTVQVHKFVVSGTLEERIDQMIESKIALAENIIGSGEQWLTELGTDQLREILSLRNDAVDDEP